MTTHPILITDTNIWIDLENSDLLAEVVRLPYKFIIPDLAVQELIQPSWQKLLTLGVSVQELDSDSIQDLLTIRSTNTRFSVTDLAAYLIARQYQLLC